MTTVVPVTITTPDGVSRTLRFTLGAQKRIVTVLGMPFKAAMDKYDSGALPEIVYSLLHDEKGRPPADITPEQLAESLTPDDVPELMAAVYSAASQGKLVKNELEALIRTSMEADLRKSIGSTSGATAPSASDSPTDNSGGDTSNAKSSPESSDTRIMSGSGISDSESSNPPSAT